VHANSSISLSEVSRLSGVSLSQLKSLNPGFKLGRTPPRVRTGAGAGRRRPQAAQGLVKSGKLRRSDPGRHASCPPRRQLIRTATR
jgi:hypothetical protein